MVDDVTLSAAQRFNIQQSQNLAQRAEETRLRLATGLRVSRPRDDPSDYFQASGLINRADDLSDIGAGLGNAIEAFNTAQIGIDTISQLTDQLRSIATDALNSGATQRDALEDQYNQLLQQINSFAEDASFSGLNYLTARAQRSVATGTDGGQTFSLPSVDLSTDGLNLSAADFSSDDAIQSNLNELYGANNRLREVSSNLGRSLSTLQIRSEGIEEAVNVLRAGAQDLVQANLSEEAAVALSIDLRAQLNAEAQKVLAFAETQLVGLVNQGG